MVTSSFLPGRGGIESYLTELCNLLQPRVAVLAPRERDGRPLPRDLGYPTYPGPGTMLVPDGRVLEEIVAVTHRLGTQRVLFGTPWPLALLGPRLATHGLRYAVIVHAAEVLVPSVVPGVGARIATAVSGAEVIFAVSDFTAGKVRDLLERHRLEIPPIERLRARVDLDRFTPDLDTRSVRDRFGIRPNDKMVLCLGRLVKRKGVHRLIEVLDQIHERAHRVTLVVAGTGPEMKHLEKAASKQRARIVFAGRVSDDDAPAVYAAADVFVLPVVDRYRGLETEGLGVVLLEAAACATPCVTGRSGGTPEAVIDGKTGFVIDAANSTELVEKVTYLLRHPDQAGAMGQAGRAHVEENFSSDSAPTALLEWLERPIR